MIRVRIEGGRIAETSGYSHQPSAGHLQPKNLGACSMDMLPFATVQVTCIFVIHDRSVSCSRHAATYILFPYKTPYLSECLYNTPLPEVRKCFSMG